MKLLSLPDDNQYITLSDDEVSDLSSQLSNLQRKLFKDVESGDSPPPSGVWLSSPNKMSLQTGNSQLFLGVVQHGQREWEVNPTSNIMLALRHMASGQLWIEKPLQSSKRSRVQPRSAFGVEPNQLEANSWSAGVKRVNLTDKFPSTLPSGSYTVTALYFDILSNPVHFSMVGLNGGSPIIESQTISIISDLVIDVPQEVALDSAKPLKFEALLNASSIEPWRGNVIALLVDEAPIIIPFTLEANTTTLSISIDLNEKSKEWQVGQYQVYVDVGDHIAGPVGMSVTK
jgi:hypothetical protein